MLIADLIQRCNYFLLYMAKDDLVFFSWPYQYSIHCHVTTAEKRKAIFMEYGVRARP